MNSDLPQPPSEEIPLSDIFKTPNCNSCCSAESCINKQRATSVLTPLLFSWENCWYKVFWASDPANVPVTERLHTAKTPTQQPPCYTVWLLFSAFWFFPFSDISMSTLTDPLTIVVNNLQESYTKGLVFRKRGTRNGDRGKFL